MHRHGPCAQQFLRPLCLLFHHTAKMVPKGRFALPRRRRQRVLKPPCLLFQPLGQIGAVGEIRTPTLSPAAASRTAVSTVSPRPRNGASTGTCAPLFPLPRERIAFYALPAKNWRLRSGSHRRPSPYEGAALLLRHGAKMVGDADWLPATYRVRTGRSLTA